MGKIFYIFITVIMLTTGVPVVAHVDNVYLTEGCGSCHVGHGKPGEPMLTASEEEFCYQCHGSEENRSAVKADGRLAASASLGDIEQEFKKPYRHPVKEGMGHSPTERLPALNASSANHAECVDCHDPHQRIQTSGKLLHEVTGYSLSGQYLEKSIHEYEICFKCHIDIIGTAEDRKNTYRQFSSSYRSQHPITRPFAGIKSPSLDLAMTEGAFMKCSDCHSSDDPDAPRGPHGSNNRFLLSGNYDMSVNVDESPYAYEFCYSCHERMSLLANESFPLHREHILGDPIRNIKGTSCFTCHNSHSSKTNPYLLDFNREAVDQDTKTGRILYLSTGRGSGECYLKCHGHSHSPGKYQR